MPRIFKILAIVTLISVISAIVIGCTTVNTYKKINSHPEVREFELFDRGESLDFRVMLEDYSYIQSNTEAVNLANDLVAMIRDKYKNKDINMRITKKGMVLGSVNIPKIK